MAKAVLGGSGNSIQFEKLLRINQLVSSKLELKPLIREVLEHASDLVSIDRTTLWLLDQELGDIFTFVGEGLDEEIRIPLGVGIAGHAAKSGETLVIKNAYDSEYFDPRWDQKTGYRTVSVLAVPLESHDGRVLGCFQAVNRLESPETRQIIEFSEYDLVLIKAMASITSVAVENALLYEQLKRQFDSFIVTLAQAVDAKDATTSNHTRMVTGIAVALAKEMGLSQSSIERVRLAAILHDFGKIGIPDNVLTKPGRHDPGERQVMKSHVLKTILILSRIAFKPELKDIPLVAGMHHEKLDGTGYPFGLRGDEIPLEGRILAVADVFQALTQTRPYKQGLSASEAIRLIKAEFCSQDGNVCEESGHLDPVVVQSLEKIVTGQGDWLSYIEEASGWNSLSEA